jgi:ParB-like chromosome segregation protein Spo0J
MTDPIDCIQWLEATTLKANHYNPNVVMNTELKLLERSILQTGWIQPILVNANRIIIDGFHRWSLSKISELMLERYAGKVPCAVLEIPDWKAMLLTVRINRAKGSHIAFKMSALVRELVDKHNVSPEQIVIEMGATNDEVNLLLQENVFKQRDIQNWKYSKAWKPIEA